MGKKYTLITGASSGIGEATAKLFAKKGKNLILIARGNEELERVKNEISQINADIDVIIRNFDLTDIHEIPALYNSFKEYRIETLINNAGFGLLENLKEHSLERVENMIKLNIEALTMLSILYTKDYQDIEGSQLINIASAAGYILAPSSVTYCATKFYVTSFTEGLAHELKASNAKMQAKVLAPSATKTNFAKVALNSEEEINYDSGYFAVHNTSEEMAEFLYKLYESDKVVGFVDHIKLELELKDPVFENLF